MATEERQSSPTPKPRREGGLLADPYLTGALSGVMIAASSMMLWHWLGGLDSDAKAQPPPVNRSIELIASIDDGSVCKVYKVRATDGRSLLITTGTGCRAVEAATSPAVAERAP
ncbi:hypothetical protein [Caulobacter sp. X]|uniref:hypothetical protein n=1 Tax=Caulobacter sp. X TaxID=2048901 RepID=UPI00117890ED|nr:hypothetical protein [Caulobacter sp. X]